MDVCDLDYPENCFDCIIDKVVLDWLLCGNDSFAKAHAMLQSVHKVLKPGGVFMIISYGMPDTRIGYLKNKLFSWNIEHTKVPKVPLDQFTPVESSKYYYIYVCSKSYV
jgi:ubiquinone/menaquinone biosynthesis C-methylase UbiE